MVVLVTVDSKKLLWLDQIKESFREVDWNNLFDFRRKTLKWLQAIFFFLKENIVKTSRAYEKPQEDPESSTTIQNNSINYRGSAISLGNLIKIFDWIIYEMTSWSFSFIPEFWTIYSSYKRRGHKKQFSNASKKDV